MSVFKIQKEGGLPRAAAGPLEGGRGERKNEPVKFLDLSAALDERKPRKASLHRHARGMTIRLYDRFAPLYQEDRSATQSAIHERNYYVSISAARISHEIAAGESDLLCEIAGGFLRGNRGGRLGYRLRSFVSNDDRNVRYTESLRRTYAQQLIEFQERRYRSVKNHKRYDCREYYYRDDHPLPLSAFRHWLLISNKICLVD